MRLDSETVFKRFGETAKVMFIFRHGFKNSESHITQKCLFDIIKHGIPRLKNNVTALQFGSEFIRTEETITAFKLWLLLNGGIVNTELPARGVWGNEQILKMFTAEVKAEMKVKNWGNYEALCILFPEIKAKWENKLAREIRLSFNELRRGQICAVPSHSPTVELAYNIYSGQSSPRMVKNELEGVFIIQGPDDSIISIDPDNLDNIDT